MRRFPIDLYTQIGLVLMTALAAGGMAPADAALEATRRRFRPILMTSTAFILGVVPLLTATGAGSASQQALGTVVFGGMLASTLLAIPFVPIFYVVMQGIGRRFGRRRATAQEIACAILVLAVLGTTRGTAVARSVHRSTHAPGVVDSSPRFLPDPGRCSSGGARFRPETVPQPVGDRHLPGLVFIDMNGRRLAPLGSPVQGGHAS